MSDEAIVERMVQAWERAAASQGIRQGAISNPSGSGCLEYAGIDARRLARAALAAIREAGYKIEPEHRLIRAAKEMRDIARASKET